MAHGTKIRVDIGSEKHQDTMLRGMAYYSSKNFNLLPKLPNVEEEQEIPDGTFQSLAELEVAEDTVESLRRQLTESRQETSRARQEITQARQEAAMAREDADMAREEAADARHAMAVRDKIVEV